MRSPLGSVDFLEERRSVLQSRFTQTSVDQCLDPAGRSAAGRLPSRLRPPRSHLCASVRGNSGGGGLPVAGVLPPGEEPDEAGAAEGGRPG